VNARELLAARSRYFFPYVAARSEFWLGMVPLLSLIGKTRMQTACLASGNRPDARLQVAKGESIHPSGDRRDEIARDFVLEVKNLNGADCYFIKYKNAGRAIPL